MELLTKRLILRDHNLTDAKSVSKHSSNLNVSKFMKSRPYPNTEAQALEYINKSIKESLTQPRFSYRLGIAKKEDNKIVGGIALSEIDSFSNNATLGYWIGEDFWSNGFMTEVVEKIIEFAFEELNIRRLNANAHPQNVASNKLLTKLGFTLEGTKIKSERVKSTGELRDTNIYGLLKENWVKK